MRVALCQTAPVLLNVQANLLDTWSCFFFGVGPFPNRFQPAVPKMGLLFENRLNGRGCSYGVRQACLTGRYFLAVDQPVIDLPLGLSTDRNGNGRPFEIPPLIIAVVGCPVDGH